MSPIPDDLDVSKPTAADVESARAMARNLDRVARGVESNSSLFGELATGDGVDDARANMAGARDGLDGGASLEAALASALGDMRTAGDSWDRAALKRRDFEAAIAEIAAAKQALKETAEAELPTAAAQQRVTDAENALRDLRARRKIADDAYDRACRRAKGKLTVGGKCTPPTPAEAGERQIGGGGGMDLPGTPRDLANKKDEAAPVPGAPATPAPAPAAPAPVPGPGASAPPARTPSTAPSRDSESGTGGVSTDVLTALASLAKSPTASLPQPQAAPPQQQPQPQLAAQSSPAPANQAQNAKTNGALTADDLGVGATPGVGLGLAGGGAPAASVGPSTPAPAAPAAPAAQVPPPSTNPGQSANNLSTVSDTTGRSDNSRGAYNAPATVASHATGTAAAPAAPLAGRGMGTGGTMPHMPMVPPMGMPAAGGGGGGSRSGGTTAVTSRSGGLDHGASAIHESVRGGTINQRRELD